MAALATGCSSSAHPSSQATSSSSGPSPRATSTCVPIGPGAVTTAGSAPAPAAAPAAVRVQLANTVGPVNSQLGGLVWNSGDSLAALQALHPAEVRVDASLQDASTGPGQLDLSHLVDRVAEIRSIGAEPLVLLSYMPKWLGQPRAGKHDPTRVAPANLDAWQAMITTVVRTLATAKQPAYRFEVWNEPDIPVFWQDTAEAFAQMAVRTTRAVENVKRATGKPLEVGGPAAAFGGVPDSMLPYLRAVAADHLALDFYSWHHYANTPFLGPDGAEGNLSTAVYKALAKRNPKSSPLDYATEIAQVEAKIASVPHGSGLSPRFIIDEWNVSGGGYDLRHDDAEGAALDAGILIDMERAGLDAADFYRAVSGREDHAGDWGLVSSKGTPKPAWWVFRAWSALQGVRLATADDPAAGVWARATKDAQGCLSVLLANFVATGSPERNVTIDLSGTLPSCSGTRTITLGTLDRSSTSLAVTSPLPVHDPRAMSVPMASQSVALVRIGCTP
jgi:hypothetical protein